METKPYSLQSPEDIAKDYGGNKQKIAQAMQMGILDPTAGVLAGMFIDRMRSAQAQEMAPQATVAQQVMGGAPAQAPLATAGGLGATAPAMPPMAPQGGAPMAPPPGMAAGGTFEPPYMKDGGLSELPVPDTMFDENRDGGYAGGGIIAFADSGVAVSPSNWGAYIEETATSLFPGLQIAGRGRTAARNAQVGGVGNSFHLIDAARDLTTPPGMSKADFIAKLKQAFGSDYDVLPSKGNSVHVEPGSKLSAGVRSGSLAPPGVGAKPTGTTNMMASSGKAPWGGNIVDAVPGAFQMGEQYYKQNMPERKNEGLNLLEAAAKKVLDPAQMKKAADEDKWMTLAEIGFNMAASNSPYLLQAAGAAAAAALPGAKADKKAREAQKREAIRDLAFVEDSTYKQAMDKANYVQAFAKDMLGLKKDDLARAFEQQKTVFQEGAATDRANIAARASNYNADQARIGQENYFNKQIISQVLGARREATEALNKSMADRSSDLWVAQNKIDTEKNPRVKRDLQKQLNATKEEYIRRYVLNSTGYDISGGMPGAPDKVLNFETLKNK